MTLPAGYRPLSAGEASGFALEADAAWAEAALRDAGTLREWAGSGSGGSPDPGPTGRGVVHVVARPDAEGRIAVRPYRRGGWMAPLLDDRYLAAGTPRPLLELQASVAVRARGIPTPPVLAGAIYPAGVFYRADLVTLLIPGADLAAVLWGPDPCWPAPRALEAAGQLVRTLEAAGVDHPDLNAKNILVNPEEDGGTLYLLDLDRCRVGEPGRVRPTSMRPRLRRSLRKLGQMHGRPLGRAEWSALAHGLGEDA